MQTNPDDAYQDVCERLYAIIQKSLDLNKAFGLFFLSLLGLFLSLPFRYNFLSFSFWGIYNEKTYRAYFSQDFDFLKLLSSFWQSSFLGESIVVFDPSYLPKSGSKTAHLGKFWSGVLGEAKKGLEFGVLALVSISQGQAYHLEAKQTLNSAELSALGDSLPVFYAKYLVSSLSSLTGFGTCLVVDAYFAKLSFLDTLGTLLDKYSLICKVRKDAYMRYLYEGEQKEGRGRNRLYAGKVNWKKLDMSYFSLAYQDQEKRLYSAILNYPALKRNFKVVVEQILDKNGEVKTYKILICTNFKYSAKKISLYYQNRFHIEFLIRDAKQHTGFTQCQARDEKKLYFHSNMSLLAVSIAKLLYAKPLEKSKKYTFSMKNVKRLFLKELIHKSFFQPFSKYKNKQKINENGHK